jgi:hypothetical protein
MNGEYTGGTDQDSEDGGIDPTVSCDGGADDPDDYTAQARQLLSAVLAPKGHGAEPWPQVDINGEGFEQVWSLGRYAPADREEPGPFLEALRAVADEFDGSIEPGDELGWRGEPGYLCFHRWLPISAGQEIAARLLDDLADEVGARGRAGELAGRALWRARSFVNGQRAGYLLPPLRHWPRTDEEADRWADREAQGLPLPVQLPEISPARLAAAVEEARRGMDEATNRQDSRSFAHWRDRKRRLEELGQSPSVTASWCALCPRELIEGQVALCDRCAAELAVEADDW